MLVFAGLPGARWWTLLTLVGCGLTVVNSAIYFPGHFAGEATPRFLLEKGEWAQQSWWLAAFYFHVVGASVCLTTGAPLMFPTFTRRYPIWHRRLGYVYLTAVLWMAAPTGLAMSLVAKGGLWGTAGFAVAAVLWWHTTWSGYRAIRRGDVPAHTRGMVRSYCLALSAPAFRLIQTLLFAAGMPDRTNYIVSLWLSLLVSLWLAESCLLRRRRRSASLAAPLAAGVMS